MNEHEPIVDEYKKLGPVKLGPTASWWMRHDPKKMLFTMSRYKFVSRMLEGYDRVLEIGCADGFGSNLINVDHLSGIDSYAGFLDNRQDNKFRSIHLDNFLQTKSLLGSNFNAIYALDVLEHVPQRLEDDFLEKARKCLRWYTGVFICGMPSLEGQAHASAISRQGHVNCKSGDALRRVLGKHFANVFMFSMNDEVVHTGFYPMAHYLIAVCVG